MCWHITYVKIEVGFPNGQAHTENIITESTERSGHISQLFPREHLEHDNFHKCVSWLRCTNILRVTWKYSIVWIAYSAKRSIRRSSGRFYRYALTGIVTDPAGCAQHDSGTNSLLRSGLCTEHIEYEQLIGDKRTKRSKCLAADLHNMLRAARVRSCITISANIQRNSYSGQTIPICANILNIWNTTVSDQQEVEDVALGLARGESGRKRDERESPRQLRSTYSTTEQMDVGRFQGPHMTGLFRVPWSLVAGCGCSVRVIYVPYSQ